MATHWGNEGVIKIGANTVAEVNEFGFETEQQPVDDTSMGDAAMTHIPGSGIPSTVGSLTCHWDETDLTGQGAMTIGASLTLNLYPEGSTAGDKFWSGLVSITKVTFGPEQKDGETIKMGFDWRANGAWTYGTAV